MRTQNLSTLHSKPRPSPAQAGPDGLGQAAEGEAQSELLLPSAPSPDLIFWEGERSGNWRLV